MAKRKPAKKATKKPARKASSSETKLELTIVPEGPGYRILDLSNGYITLDPHVGIQVLEDGRIKVMCPFPHQGGGKS